jgi:hypothetical protein
MPAFGYTYTAMHLQTRAFFTGWLLAASTLLVALLMVHGGIHALANVLGRPAPAWVARVSAFLRRYAIWAPLLWAPVVLLGMWVSQVDAISWLALPLLHALAVALPVLWFAGLATRGVTTGGAGRAWGIFGIAATYNTTLLIIVELLVSLVVGLALLLVLVAGDPNLATQLTLMAQRLANAPLEMEALARILRPLLDRPLVGFAGLAMFSGLVPVVEELFKSLPVWVLASARRITPAEGFVAGVLSGGAMALVESLGFSTSIAFTSWTAIVLQRAGTDLLHITTTGLVGWAIASAVAERRYLRLAVCFLLAALIHGAWNALALVGVAGEANGILAGSGLLAFARFAPYAMTALGVGIFLLLLGLNRANRERVEPQVV